MGGDSTRVGEAINTRELNKVSESWIRAVEEAGKETIPKTKH